MTDAQLDALCAGAIKRINAYISRVAGQHLRRMRETWSRP